MPVKYMLYAYIVYQKKALMWAMVAQCYYLFPSIRSHAFIKTPRTFARLPVLEFTLSILDPEEQAFSLGIY